MWKFTITDFSMLTSGLASSQAGGPDRQNFGYIKRQAIVNDFTSYLIVISHYNCYLGIPATDIEMPLVSLALVSSQNFSFIGSFSREKG